VMILNGDHPLHHTQGWPFIDPKASATDTEDGDLTDFLSGSRGRWTSMLQNRPASPILLLTHQGFRIQNQDR
jgi:hypothetical protein